MSRTRATLLSTIGLAVGFISCSSPPPAPTAPPRPAWVTSPARFEGDGWIVFIGVGEDRSPESAHFKARAMALQNMANECSFVPLNTATDTPPFDETVGIIQRSTVKMAVLADRCRAARGEIKASDVLSQSDQGLEGVILRYQALYDPPELVEQPNSSAQVEADESAQYYVLKERLALAKQAVILASDPGTRIPALDKAVRDFEAHHYEMVSEPRAYSDRRLNAYAHTPSAVRDTIADRARLANTYPPTPTPENRTLRPPRGGMRGAGRRRRSMPGPSPTPSPAPNTDMPTGQTFSPTPTPSPSS